MDDLDQLCQELTEISRLKIGVAAMALAYLTNQYCPKVNLHWGRLVGTALKLVGEKRAREEVIPDVQKFVLVTMTEIADELIDSYVQQFATDVTKMDPMERNLHATQILERLENVILADDDEAKKIWPLMLEQRSGPEIERICKFRPGHADTIKKRIRRRALTYLRGLLGGELEP